MDNKTIFLNADYIVIEYIDIVKSPYLVLLDSIRHNEKIKEIIKTEDIENLSKDALIEWYLNRKHQNFYIDLNRYPDKISNQVFDDLLTSQMNEFDALYENAEPLTIVELLKLFNIQKISKDIIVYLPYSNKAAISDMENLVGNKYIFMDNFDDVLKKAGFNSTYFLSDIDKINYMAEKNCLARSSITLPMEYRYNKKNMKDFRIDFNELLKTHIFKLSFFYACTEFNQEELNKFKYGIIE